MNDIKMKWLDTRVKGGYVTFGVPHKRGELTVGDTLDIEQEGKRVVAEMHPIAYWNDGSVKWTSVTAELSDAPVTVKKGTAKTAPAMPIEETDDTITIDNGSFKSIFYKSGKTMLKANGLVVSIRAIKTLISEDDDITVKKNITYYGDITECVVEYSSAIKSVIRIKGTHKANDGSSFLQFIVRFIVYKSSGKIDIKHTFIYDGDVTTDMIGGVAVDVKRKMSGLCFNRRIKLAGDCGVFHEPLQILNIWRPRIGTELYKAQMRGETVDVSTAIDSRNGQPCADQLDNVTIWDSFKYTQVSPDSYIIKKKTAPKNVAYIDAGFGRRAKGFMYAGDENGGFAIGMRHFFEKAPSAINAKGLSTNEGTITAWIHPTDSEPLDMRHYDTVSHDQTFYEGFPFLGSDPVGVAATNELAVFIYDETPSDDIIMKDAESVSRPPVLVCEPEHYRDTYVLGAFSLPDRSTPLKAWIEDELDKCAKFYMNEVEQRHWYGLYNYGDIMHTYDFGRHCWRYDMGGYAWQNTELLPTFWLWYAFLRSGRGDLFDFAEAMSRHAADVDTYHIGDKKGLGSRHNVIHWGDSCNEPRVGMAGHHRPLYYLMGGDARIGDVFDDVRDADLSTIGKYDPLGFFYKPEEMKLPSHARTGPDWSSYCSNWYVEWERNANTKYRDKIKTGIEDLKKAPLRLISGSNFEYDPNTGHLGYIGETSAGGSHLVVCMGGPQTWIELADLMDDEDFKNMVVEYGAFYYLPKEEKAARTNGLTSGKGFEYPYMAAAVVGYAAQQLHDEKLAYKVWQVLIHSLAGEHKDEGFDAETVENYFNNEKLSEMFWLMTNFAAQWCVNTIFALEYTKEFMLPNKEDYNYDFWVKYGYR